VSAEPGGYYIVVEPGPPPLYAVYRGGHRLSAHESREAAKHAVAVLEHERRRAGCDDR
jgi:hypothetical protein